jgi:hypothetical protein
MEGSVHDLYAKDSMAKFHCSVMPGDHRMCETTQFLCPQPAHTLPQCLLCAQSISIFPGTQLDTLTHPATINIIHSTSDKARIITQQECNDLGDLDRLSTPLLRCDLQPSRHVFGIFAGGERRVD